MLTTDELTAVSDADTSGDRDVAAGIFALNRFVSSFRRGWGKWGG